MASINLILKFNHQNFMSYNSLTTADASVDKNTDSMFVENFITAKQKK